MHEERGLLKIKRRRFTGIGKLRNKDILLRKMLWASVILTGKGLLKIMFRRFTGIGKLRNREIVGR